MIIVPTFAGSLAIGELISHYCGVNTLESPLIWGLGAVGALSTGIKYAWDAINGKFVEKE